MAGVVVGRVGQRSRSALAMVTARLETQRRGDIRVVADGPVISLASGVAGAEATVRIRRVEAHVWVLEEQDEDDGWVLVQPSGTLEQLLPMLDERLPSRPVPGALEERAAKSALWAAWLFGVALVWGAWLLSDGFTLWIGLCLAPIGFGAYVLATAKWRREDPREAPVGPRLFGAIEYDEEQLRMGLVLAVAGALAWVAAAFLEGWPSGAAAATGVFVQLLGVLFVQLSFE